MHQLDQQVFRFVVSCKQVGFVVLGLNSFSSVDFKLAFLLCNDASFAKALAFSKSDSGPSFTYEEVHSKKCKLSFADVARAPPPPLSGANAVLLGANVAWRIKDHLQRSSSYHIGSFHSQSRPSVFQRISFPRKSVFQRLEFGNSRDNFQTSKGQWAALVHGSKSLAFTRPGTVAGFPIYRLRC